MVRYRRKKNNNVLQIMQSSRQRKLAGKGNFKISKGSIEKTLDHINSIPNDPLSEFYTESKELSEKTIKNLLFACNYLMSKDHAFDEFESLVDLLDNCGAIVPSDNYRNRPSCLQFVELISNAIEDRILAELKSSVGYSLIVDEGCDISNEEHIVISAQYWFKSQIYTRFLKLIAVLNKKAETIFQAVKSYMGLVGLNFDTLIGLCTDGTNSMSSTKEGLIGKMLNENKGIIHTHCVCHRFSLTLHDVIEKLPYLIEYQGTLQRIHTYFSRSAIRTDIVDLCQEIFNRSK